MTVSTDRVRVWAFAAVCLLACATGVRAGQVELISQVEPSLVSDTGAIESNLFSYEAVSVSADGRWVAFTSRGHHLVPAQVNPPGPHSYWGIYHVFLHDRQTGETVLVDHAHGSPATTANFGSGAPQISADGRWVLFSSNATDLVAGFTDASPDTVDHSGVNLFLYDRLSGTSRLIDRSPSSPTRTGNGYTFGAVMTSNGAWIAFTSRASDLVAGQTDTNDLEDVFLYERATGAITLVSRTPGSASASGNFGSLVTAITDDGGSVVFQSNADNLVPGQAAGGMGLDVFLWTRPTGAVSLISHTPGSPAEEGNGPSRYGRVSQDARYVAFESDATNLAGVPFAGGAAQVFLHDRLTGATTLASHEAGLPGQAGDGWSRAPQMSADGRFIAYQSGASNLVAGQTGGQGDLFLYDRDTGENTMVSHRSDSTNTGTGYQTLLDMSADGRYVLFGSNSDALVAGQVDTSPLWFLATQDIFLYDRNTGGNTLVSHVSGAPATAGGGHSADSDMSPDGAWIVFVSQSTGLDADARDFNRDYDAFVHERTTGVNHLLSRRAPDAVSQTASGASFTSFAPETSISQDGRWVAFVSDAPNLVPGQVDSSYTYDVFLRDRTAGVTYLVSRAASSLATAGDRESKQPVITPDGRYIAFSSLANNLVDGQQEGATNDWDLFVWDRVSGTTVLASHTSASPTTGAAANIEGSRSPAISDDGRFVAFLSDAAGLVAGQIDDNSWFSDVYLWDRDAAPGGGVTLVSHVETSPVQTGPFESGPPAISGDGGFVAFASQSSLLASEPAEDDTSRLYLFTRSTAGMTLVAPTYEEPSYGPSPAMSQDGAWLAFTSTATDLVPGQQNLSPYNANVFLWERATGAFTLVSRAAGTTTTGTDGFAPDLSADGRYTAFSSSSPLLVFDQEDAASDVNVFLFDRVTGAMTLVSRSAAAPVRPGNDDSVTPRISADGRRVAFRSQAVDLVAPSGTYFGRDAVYVFDRAAGTSALASRGAGSAVAIRHGSDPVISADGLTVAFTSQGSDLVPGDLNLHADAFAYTVAAAGQPGRFYTVAPCRLLDSRAAGAAFASGAPQTVTAHGACGIPPTATAVAANVTVTQTSAQGHLTLHAGDLPAPGASTINFAAGQTRANNAILPLAANGAGTLAVTPFVLGGGSVHVIVDVTGYFE